MADFVADSVADTKKPLEIQGIMRSEGRCGQDWPPRPFGGRPDPFILRLPGQAKTKNAAMQHFTYFSPFAYVSKLTTLQD